MFDKLVSDTVTLFSQKMFLYTKELLWNQIWAVTKMSVYVTKTNLDEILLLDAEISWSLSMLYYYLYDGDAIEQDFELNM